MTLGPQNGWRTLSRLRVSLVLPVALAGLGLIVLVRASRDAGDQSGQHPSKPHTSGSKDPRGAGAEACAWDLVPGSRAETRAPRNLEDPGSRVEGETVDAPARGQGRCSAPEGPPPRARSPDTLHAPRGPPA